MIVLLFGLISIVSAKEISWEFYYVSENVEDSAPPSIWITQTLDGGMDDEITEDNLNRDTEKILYLHTESNGAEGLEMTLSPLVGNDTYIPYSFSYSGPDDVSGSAYVEEENKIIPLAWMDPDPIRIRRNYTLTWLPDQSAVATAQTGTYKTTFTVEVKTL